MKQGVRHTPVPFHCPYKYYTAQAANLPGQFCIHRSRTIRFLE